MEITDEQRKRAEANRLAALAKRKGTLTVTTAQEPWKLFKCRKISGSSSTDLNFPKPQPAHFPENFRVKLEICSPDSFSATPEAVEGFEYPGEAVCLQKLYDCLSDVECSHYTQNHRGGKASVYKLRDYDTVLRCLKNSKWIDFEEIPWGTFNVVEKLSHGFVAGRWIPCRPEHLSDETVNELVGKLPKVLLNSLLPFQLDGVRFGLQRGGRCLIADEMGLGKTLQAIAIACCFMNEGSVLVVCPAILRFTWAEEFERWLPFCLPSDIHLVFGHRNNPAYLKRCPRIVVISYTMLHRLRKNMLEREWSLLIVDESHHVRCTKKKSEANEVQAVLDVATKAKHVILLSGTPSLSRPYDIFHQINMLWPGLLGKNKYEFAKTYCGAKSVQKSDGKIYKDLSKGIRLDELNVLLKQTVMIRRLKEHVMLQLPPKRRQIIRLLLKKSDMISAKAVVREMNICASENGVDEGSPLQFDENGDCCDTTIDLSYQELGIAKLSRFLEWLSIHPIISEKVGENVNSHKMIIFAHHHKVLDGIQEFICEKGTGYVRIDGKTNARDRQEAVHMFQSSREVKIAIIGIMAGGVGLNLSAAQNVAFLELPKNPNLLLQAEDRAHRRGQTNAVNIYIFCAKDTLDEPQWRYLNKSLYFVSSTTNGKYGAIQEIAVEHVSYLGTTQESNVRSQDQFLDAGMTTIQRMATGISQHMENTQDEKYEEQNEGGVRSSQIENFQNESDSISSPTTKMETMDVERIVGDAKSSLQIESLRFEVSQYTGRIHLYSCVKGKDIRPRPLFENFRLEELESVISFSLGHTKKGHNCIKDNPEFRNALLAFINEWKHLRPIEQKKLLGKPLQLPLTVELCCLSENTRHTKEGLLKCGSKRRKTPLFEISHPLPSNAIWKRVSLCSFNGKKAKEYSQGWTSMGEPLCKLCQNPCQNNNATAPYFLEDLFCNLSCYEEYRARTSARFLRDELFQIEHGVCRNCKLDCHKLVKHIRPLSLENRQKYIKEVAPEIGRRKKLLHKIVHDPTEKNTWHADHIIPVYRGGGECRLENMRTLCVACHADVTAAQCAERCSKRKEAKKKLEILISGLSNGQNIEQNHAKLKDDDISEDELLIKVPGSAYS